MFRRYKAFLPYTIIALALVIIVIFVYLIKHEDREEYLPDPTATLNPSVEITPPASPSDHIQYPDWSEIAPSVSPTSFPVSEFDSSPWPGSDDLDEFGAKLPPYATQSPAPVPIYQNESEDIP